MPRQDIQLATTLTDRIFANLPHYVDTMRKLNGMRLWQRRDDMTLITSGGNVLQFHEHIYKELALLPSAPWDGELYLHQTATCDSTFEDVTGAGRRTKNRPTILQEYHIFDIKSMAPWSERRKILEQLDYHIENLGLKYIKVVKAETIEKQMIYDRMNQYVSAGYEGIIVHTEGPYIDCGSGSRRSKFLIKFKPSVIVKYRIKGFIQGKGRNLERTGSIVVEMDDYQEFAVGTGPVLNDAGRTNTWNDRFNLIGDFLHVKHEKLFTNTGLPKCTAAMMISDGDK